MKLNFFLALGAIAAISGCTAEHDLPGVAGNVSIEASLNPALNADGSRTAVVEDYEDAIAFNWLPADHVGVFTAAGTENAKFAGTHQEPVGNATFSGTLSGTPVFAYYPHTPGQTDPTAISGTVATEQHFDAASNELVTKSDYKCGTHQGNNKFKFEHILPLIQFEVKATANAPIEGERLQSVEMSIDPAHNLAGSFTFNVKTGTINSGSLANLTQAVKMTWDDTPDLVAGKTYRGYLSVLPQDLAGATALHFVITTSGRKVSFTMPCKGDKLEGGYFYTVKLHWDYITEHATDIKEEVVEPEPADEPVGTWVSGLQSRLSCANTVFSLPSTPFMHKIRIEGIDKSGIRAAHLPLGLKWNAARALVYGQVAEPGDYEYTIIWTDAQGAEQTEAVRLHVGTDLHQPTPHMGWQSWNVLEKNIDEASIKAVADAMVSNGLRDAGYVWLGIDDCWQKPDGSRDSNGVPVVNPTKFPTGLKTVTDYIHSLGMKAGIYSDCGVITCASEANGTSNYLLGAYDHEAEIAKAFTEWGFDKLKEDWFWKNHGDNGGELDPASFALAYELYSRMGSNIRANGNKIMLSMCEWGIHEPWKWGPEAGASSWRMSYDHRDAWMGQYGTTGTIFNKKPAPNSNNVNSDGAGIGLYNTLNLMVNWNLSYYAGVNRFNDPDMLVVGIRGKGSSSSDLVYTTGGLTDDETVTEFAMWCMWSSPLLITVDVTNWNSLKDFDKKLLLNTELIALDQDPMGQQAEFIKASGNVWYFCKDLANGDVAIAAVNLGDSSANFAINISDFEALDSSKTYTVKELISGTGGASLSGSLNQHATKVFRFTAQ